MSRRNRDTLDYERDGEAECLKALVEGREWTAPASAQQLALSVTRFCCPTDLDGDDAWRRR